MAALKESEVRYRTIFKNVQDVYFETGLDGKILEISPSVEYLLDYVREELIGRPVYELYKDPNERGKVVEQIVNNEKVNNYEVILLNKHGLPCFCSVNAVVIRDDQGEPIKLTGSLRDVTEKKQSEIALIEREELLRSMGEIAHIGGWEFDAQTLEGTWTEEVARIHDMDPATKTDARLGISFYVDDSQEKIKAAIKEAIEYARSYDLELELITAKGNRKWVRTIGNPITEGGRVVKIRGAFQDITQAKEVAEEKSKLEAQLRQAQKLEAVGTLAGGIAHDFNNLLAAIMGYAELALDNVSENSENKVFLTQILTAATRAQNLVKQILTFSRKTAVQTKPLDLNRQVRSVAQMIKQTIPKMVNVELHLAEKLRYVNGDPVQLEQVLFNLATNANDAMPDGGRLIIETENVFLDAEYCQEHLEAEPGDYVLLQVSDTGQGMSKQVLSQIFDPFYTTKAAGKGTGLGLSTVYGIIKAHRGHIYCYSELGQGTTFKIYFPAIKPSEKPSDADLETTISKTAGNGETILLVDDEEPLLNVGKLMLTRAGYNVITADCGEEALEKFRQKSDEIDLVIMDISMPGMGGHKCLVEMLKLDPNKKVLVASGYSRNGQLKDTLAAGAAGYIAKPFERADMLETVRAILDA
jgi:PAS domain S-box-containing protein